ncbi:MAG: flavocytochrome c [Firmicutes bacterium]|jgi:fumarate reductase flavoprotein subunit|nr:flavocytochrome c [Bacillota bacterium]
MLKNLLCVVLAIVLLSSTLVGAQSVMSADVVVVGGGGSGLVAALSAAEAGAKVVVLEKMAYLGGATMMSGGVMPAAGTRYQEELGIEDSVEAFARDIFRPGHYSQRRDLVYTVANNAKDVLEWLEGLGVKWTLVTGHLRIGQTTFRNHEAEGKGQGIINVLVENVKKNENITVLLDTPGVGLITDTDGVVRGVAARTKDGEDLTIIADSTILCTSGFAANAEMVAKYIPSIIGAYPMFAPGATGDGIIWGVKLGAAVANMGAYQAYAPFSRELKQNLDLYALYRGGILVNKNGDRFTNEYLGYSELGTHIVNQPDHIAYMIIDAENAKNTPALAGWEAAGIVKKADTPEELAEQLGIPPAKLRAVFDDYVEGIKQGEDRFNRTKLPKEWKPPFYAVEATGDLRHTQGGLVTDTDARVLKTDGEIIPGLYAAGGVTEGFTSAGGPAYMSGTGLLQAFVFGRIAGQSAALRK